MPHTHTARPLSESTIHCVSCNLTLAGISAGLIIVRRDRSEFVAERIHSIRCHRCGHNNTIAPTSPDSAVTSSYPTITDVHVIA